MDSDLFLNWLASDNGLVVHLSVLASLILGGFGFPIPEDVPLLLAGVAGARSIVSFKAVLATAYLGVVLADQILYFLGRLYGKRLLAAGTRSPFLPAITESRVEKVRESLRRRQFLYICLARHLFPIRTATFIIAGTLHVPFLEFLIADAVAALLSVTIVVSIGYFLGTKISLEAISRGLNDFTWLAVGILCTILLFSVMKRCKRKSRERLARQGKAAE